MEMFFWVETYEEVERIGGSMFRGMSSEEAVLGSRWRLSQKLAREGVKALVFLRLLVCWGVVWGGLLGFGARAMAEGAVEGEGGGKEGERSQINIPVPHGQDVLGIRIPHYNDKNELILLITSDVSRRTDEDNIELEKMKIDFYDAERRRMVVDLQKANFHLPSKKLVKQGDGDALITREDFTIRGKELEFDMDAQTGVMTGAVTMTVYRLGELESEKKEP